MTISTWVVMIGVLLFVWGGFAVCLTTALRKEAGKKRGGEADAGR